MQVDCVVIGGGAAGLMCAATAGQRGRSVMVLDRSNKVGKKILMSGGGRCNFTNLYAEPDNFISDNPHFCKSALSRYTQYDFLDLIDRHQLAYHEKTLGQLFCDNKSRDILNILLAECESAGVQIHTDCQISSVEQIEDAKYRFELKSNLGSITCQSLVVASGGLSIPKMGASGFGYELARQFGLKVTPRHAALVPFTLKGRWLKLASDLAGVSMPVVAECRGQSFKEAMLFTHKGLSGPAVLQVSNYWFPSDQVSINYLPELDLAESIRGWQRESGKAELRSRLATLLPKRFVAAWLTIDPAIAALQVIPVSELNAQQIDQLSNHFHHWTFVPAGTEGYKTAEVTRGGVDVDGVSSKTFEAKTVPGLYFIGEVLDVTGWLGGYNFQWAWASGHCAGGYV